MTTARVGEYYILLFIQVGFHPPFDKRVGYICVWLDCREEI